MLLITSIRILSKSHLWTVSFRIRRERKFFFSWKSSKARISFDNTAALQKWVPSFFFLAGQSFWAYIHICTWIQYKSCAASSDLLFIIISSMNIKVHSSFILPYIWEAECPSFCYPVHIVVCYRHYGVIVILSNRGLSVIAHITFGHLYSKPAIPLTKWRACKSARTGEDWSHGTFYRRRPNN